MTALLLGAAGPSAASAADRVLVLDSTVLGSTSPEVQRIQALGLEADVVDAAGWKAKSAADFASYRAIVLGDQSCSGNAQAAEETADVWGPKINGNVMVVGTDPVYHDGQGGRGLTDAGIAYATDQPGKTGAYLTLSCYYHGAAENTPVPLLDGLSSAGSFTVRGVGCYNDAHITAEDSALGDLTDATLSNWSCSVHEAFDGYPSDFVTLAIARDIGETYTAPDGSVGTPYILARGSGTSYLGRSYVALGDSVAAGEGIAYDYRWSTSDKRWHRFGPKDPKWDTTYTSALCHQTPQAHPRVAADILSAKLLHLACTGASARGGVLNDQDHDGKKTPAQLGSSVSGFAPPNSRYDDAKPDIVSVSLGANDVNFADRVGKCYGIDLGGCNTDQSTLNSPLATQKSGLESVLDEIKRRAPDGKVPLTVLTQYIDPFPAQWTDKCPDLDIPVPGLGLSKKEIDFLRGGLHRLNDNIRAVAESRGAFVVAPSSLFANHVFCTSDPWVFGPSIRTNNLLGSDRSSTAPFHPTAAGQAELGKGVAELIKTKLAVRSGKSIRVGLPHGRLAFDEVTSAGEAAIVPESLGLDRFFPVANIFRKVAGFDIVTSAGFTGNVKISLPSPTPLSLFHFVLGHWVQLPSTYENGYVSGFVDSLSPFALGEPVSPVTARLSPLSGGRAPFNVSLDGSGSSVDDGSAINSYEWNFGDGATGTGVTVHHKYLQSGTYQVVLTVTAENGAVDDTSSTVVITNNPPIAGVQGPAEGAVGQLLALSSHSSDPNGRILNSTWDFGDSTVPIAGSTVKHKFAKPGRYVVRHEVTDNEGEARSVSFPIIIGPRVPPLRPGKIGVSRTLHWDKNGRLRVKLRCKGARRRCHGTIVVRLGKRRLASGRINIPSGRTKTLHLKARNSVAKHLGKKPRKVTIRVALDGGNAVVIPTRLKRPGAR
jgi:lysophospholipase L1-like esterase